MKLSVVTPSFNQAQFLEQAIRSVAEQGIPVEHIVVDGGSTDGSRAILERYSDRLAYWCSEPDRGQTDALNKGIARATGDVVAWINSDDFFLPGAFATVLRRFGESDAPDVVFGDIVTVDASGRLLREYRHDEFSLESLLCFGLDVHQQGLFWRSGLNSAVFPLEAKLRFCMDVQLLARLALSGARFARVPHPLGAFRVHAATKSSTIADVGRREHEEVIRHAREVLGSAAPRATRRRVAVMRRLAFLRRGDFRYALLGGRLGASRAAAELASEANLWSTTMSSIGSTPSTATSDEARWR